MIACATNKDSIRPGHLSSLISLHYPLVKNSYSCLFLPSWRKAKTLYKSAMADVLADLSLPWTHMVALSRSRSCLQKHFVLTRADWRRNSMRSFLLSIQIFYSSITDFNMTIFMYPHTLHVSSPQRKKVVSDILAKIAFLH